MSKILLVILITCSSLAFGQNKNPVFLTLTTKGGFLMAHRTQMAHLSQKNAYGFDLSLSKQYTNGYSAVKASYPINGLTFEYRNFGFDEVLGRAFSINQFMSFPVWQSPKNFCLDFTMGAGIGYITKQYDKFDNPTNNAIGSPLNAKVVFKFSATKYFKKLHFGGGLELSHFSNGNIKMPNLGLNNFSTFFKIGYNFNEYVNPKTNQDEQVFTMELLAPYFAVELIGSMADVPPVPYDSKQYPVGALRLSFIKPVNKVWSWEVAADAVYNQSNLFRYKDSAYTWQDVPQFGLYGGMSFTYFKSQIVFGLGYYLRDKINPLGRIYNRIGYRYYFDRKWFGLFNIRANFGRADFFELGVGYKF